ncbi:MAG: hypothetical protein M1822_003433 [Bathelium mastoideum]|nr:MAG: hypothetical protein M1822_003433 [Bathelium mastoideum]
MTPVVPLRGSISASEDLSTLSYIAGVLEGNPDVYVRTSHAKAHPTYMRANEALRYLGIEPVRLRAKEGLGIMNGTAPSCAFGAIVVHQAQHLAVFSQLLTAMATEALLGTARNYHPFISAVRPHPGQAEAAANILAFLSGSKPAPDEDPRSVGLAQDRYALRTAPQWIGPQLEDVSLAYQQVRGELNSTTDNPLLDVDNELVYHGGNFQAASITSAMEKTTSALQMIGKLIYAQSFELINNQTNKGLPPNLSADDPSTSFTFKGFDVNMAAYVSELAYLAHPISTHVQSTEMHNQSVSSMALVAARNAQEAVEVVSLMAATYLYALCQALDLRCLHLEFVKAGKPELQAKFNEAFEATLPHTSLGVAFEGSWQRLMEKWNALSHLDLADRGQTASNDALGSLVELLLQHSSPMSECENHVLSNVGAYRIKAGETLSRVYDETRERFFYCQSTPSYIGQDQILHTNLFVILWTCLCIEDLLTVRRLLI